MRSGLTVGLSYTTREFKVNHDSHFCDCRARYMGSGGHHGSRDLASGLIFSPQVIEEALRSQQVAPVEQELDPVLTQRGSGRGSVLVEP